MPHAQPVAKYHLVELALAQRIRQGHYAGGELPGERELAAEFGVARVTVRHALARLQDQGLVLRRQRRGTAAVADAQAPQRRRLLREHVDGFLDRGRPDKRRVLHFGRTDAPPAVADALALAPGTPVLRVVRLRSSGLGPAAPLTYTESFVPWTLALQAGGITRAALTRKAFVQVLEEAGVRIVTADQRVSAEGASPTVSAALGIALHAPVLRLTRVIRDAQSRPVQLLWGWYRADRFELRMELSRADDATRVWIEHH
jgi:GntR family transcriptional regulator